MSIEAENVVKAVEVAKLNRREALLPKLRKLKAK